MLIKMIKKLRVMVRVSLLIKSLPCFSSGMFSGSDGFF